MLTNRLLLLNRVLLSPWRSAAAASATARPGASARAASAPTVAAFAAQQQQQQRARASASAPDSADAMAAAPAQAVRAALKAMLPTLDMGTSTERQIRELLADKLGGSMDAHKKLIKQEIEAFLTASLEAAAEAEEAALALGSDDAFTDSDDDFIVSDDDEPSQRPIGKRKRAAAAAAAAGGGRQASKVARTAAGAGGAGPAGGIQLDTQGYKWLSVSTYKGQTRVDVRNFFRDKASGELKPTKKGITLAQSEWAALQGVLPALSQAVADGNDAFVAELVNNVRATTSTFQGKLQAGVREYYAAADGEMKPGTRGIALAPEQLQALVGGGAAINAQLPGGGEAAAAAAPAPAAAAGGGGGGGAAAAAAAKPAAGGGSSSSSDAAAVDLGGRKRATISTYTGSACVDLREYYEKDGELRPGKKGISLKPDQWRLIAGAAGDISAALSAHDTAYKLELGNKRQVSLSDFKGVWYVGVREYYEKNGSLLPGAKGLNMNAAQWQKLVDGMEGLTAALG